MNSDNALQYALAGFFALIFATPLIAFWRRKAWARNCVIATLLIVIAACFRFFNIDTAENSQLSMLAITLIPPLAAATVAGAIDLLQWRMRVIQRDRYRRHFSNASKAGRRPKATGTGARR